MGQGIPFIDRELIHQNLDDLQKAEIILGLYKCNYSLIVKELKLHSAF